MGFALHMNQARVIAFDRSEKAQRVCRENAERNQIAERMDIRGPCTPTVLRDCLAEVGRCFLLVDCEGAELELLDAALVPEIADCDFIVDCHDFKNRRISGEIVRRFAATHEIVEVREGARDPNTDPTLRQLPGLDRWLAISENRPECMHWLLCNRRPELL